MTTFRKRHDIVAYRRTVLDDDRISLGAKGLFACLVSTSTETEDLEMHDMLTMTIITTNNNDAELHRIYPEKTLSRLMTKNEQHKIYMDGLEDVRQV